MPWLKAWDIFVDPKQNLARSFRGDSLCAEVEEWNHCLAIRSHAELQKLFQLSFIDGAWSLGLEKLSEQELKALRIGFYGADGKLIKSWTAADIREGRLSLGSWASQDRGRLFLKISGQGWSLSKTLTAR